MTQIWAPGIALSFTGGNAANTAFRVECKNISGGGGQIRVILMGPLKAARLYAGVAGTAPGTVATPVELKIGGQSGCDIPDGVLQPTDYADLVVAAGQTVIVGGDHALDGGQWRANLPTWEGGQMCPNADEWYGPTPSWNVAAPSGFQKNAGLCVAVAALEVPDAPPSPPPGLNIVSDWVLSEANDSVNPVRDAFMGSDVLGMEWASVEIGAACVGVSWLGQAFRAPIQIERITYRHRDANTWAPQVHLLYGDDPAALNVAGPFTVNQDAVLDLPALGAHRYWRLRAAAAPVDRWHVRDCYMYAAVPEWLATRSWAQTYIETNIPWTADPSVSPTGEPLALLPLPMNARWCDLFNEFDKAQHAFIARRRIEHNFEVRAQLYGDGIEGVHLHVVKNDNPTGGFYRPIYRGEGNWSFEIKMPCEIGDRMKTMMQIEQGTNIVVDGHRSLFEID